MNPEQLRELAISTLVEVAGDRQASGTARATAAKTLLQLGEIDAFAPPHEPATRKTPDPAELEAQLTEKLNRLLRHATESE